jgi:type I restriction enzyme, S subunit
MLTIDEPQIPLKDLAEITAGPSGSLLDRLSGDPEGIPVVSPSDITDRHDVDTRRLRRLPRKHSAKLERFTLREDDLVIVRQGSLGRLALVGPLREKWLYSSSCIRVRLRSSRILPQYLTLYLSFPPVQEELHSRAAPGTVQSLNSAALEALPITVPPVSRQRDVVAVVADIDELAGVHRKTADHLDTLRLSILGDFIESV